MIPQYNTQQFEWNRETNTFSIDVSTLQHGGGLLAPFDQIYPDSDAQGFLLVSHKTGRGVMFELTSIVKDAEGDTTSWVLQPTFESICKYDNLTHVKVVVWNT